MEPYQFRYGNWICICHLISSTIASMEPYYFRYGNMLVRCFTWRQRGSCFKGAIPVQVWKLSSMISPDSTNASLQWSHTSSGMETFFEVVNTAPNSSLQWSHTSSGMETWVNLAVDWWAEYRFNGAIPVQVWKRGRSQRGIRISIGRFNGAIPFQVWKLMCNNKNSFWLVCFNGAIPFQVWKPFWKNRTAFRITPSFNGAIPFQVWKPQPPI